VRSADGQWYLVRIIPYRTLDNVIDGVVMTFTEITALKTLDAEVRLARDYAESIVNTVREPLVVLNSKFEVVSASRAFYTTFKVEPEATQGNVLYKLGNNEWDIPRLHELLENVLPKNRSFDNFLVDHNFPGIGQKKMLLNAREIIGQEGAPHLILLAMEVIAPVSNTEEKGKSGR
jgi:two-component system CheB/CheR fusion protein